MEVHGHLKESPEKLQDKRDKDYYKLSIIDTFGRPVELRTYSTPPGSTWEAEYLEDQKDNPTPWVFVVQGGWVRIAARNTQIKSKVSNREAIAYLMDSDNYKDPDIKGFIDKLFQKVFGDSRDPLHVDKLEKAVAAWNNHHHQEGGLIRHVMEIQAIGAKLAPLIEEIYGVSVDVELFSLAALLHDIGKCDEYHYTGEGDDGRRFYEASDTISILGHLPYGAYLAQKFWPEGGSDETLLKLIHCCLSHHGRLEWGSPITPQTPEAMLLFQCDDMSAKWEVARRKLSGDKSYTQTISTRFIESIKL